jgi:hypothetical protein
MSLKRVSISEIYTHVQDPRGNGMLSSQDTRPEHDNERAEDRCQCLNKPSRRTGDAAAAEG